MLIDFAAKVSASPKKPSLTPLHCDGGGGVMLRVGCRDGGNGGGSGFNTIMSRPLEKDFLFSPLFFGLPTLRGDSLFGASFSLEQEGSAAATTPSVDAISGAALLKARRRHSVHSILLSCPSSMPGTALGAAPVILHTELLIIWLTAMPAMMPRGHLEGGS